MSQMIDLGKEILRINPSNSQKSTSWYSVRMI